MVENVLNDGSVEEKISSDAARSYFLKACRRIFREIVKGSFLLGVSYQDLCQTLKWVMIDVARQQVSLLEGKNETSLVCALTGIPRAGISDMRDPTEKEPVTALVVRLWRSDPRYQGRDLPRRTRNDDPSLIGLVNSVLDAMKPKSEVRAKAVVDAMEAAGIIFKTQGGGSVYRLHRRAFREDPKVKQDFYFMSENVGDHLAVVMHNILLESGNDRLFERAYYPAVSPSATTLEKVREVYFKGGASRSMPAFLEEIRRLVPVEHFDEVADAYTKRHVVSSQQGQAQEFLEGLRDIVNASEASSPSVALRETQNLDPDFGQPMDLGFRVGVYFWMPRNE